MTILRGQRTVPTAFATTLSAALLLGVTACAPVVLPAPSPEEDAVPPVVAATPAPSVTPQEPAGPTARPALVPLPQLELVTPRAAPVTSPQEAPMPRPPVVSDPVAFAVEDLAARLSVPADAITVVRVEEVDWPDGSLGCPQPGMRYKQMLVNGSFIQLSVDGRLYNYHSGGSRSPFLCVSKDEALPEDLPGGLRGDPNV